MRLLFPRDSRGKASFGGGVTLILSALSGLANAIDLDINSPDSIKAAAGTIAHGMVSYYKGNYTGGTPGMLPDPYFWWEAGAMMGALIDYWFYTGDSQYNDLITQAMLFQGAPTKDFMPLNQTSTEGNDDQAFWTIAAMQAAERGFPNPPKDQAQWLALVQAVFNKQTTYWDAETCGGGLRWQIFKFNNGYDYKNTISNGCYFHMGARLARYTKNNTYAELATRTYKWVEAVGLITPNFQFYDGANVDGNCTTFDKHMWSYNFGVFISGCAYMYNHTNGTGPDAAYWTNEINTMLDAGLNLFFDKKNGNVMYEVSCEPYGRCNIDQRSFKAYLSRWLALTAQLAPFTAGKIWPLLQVSAKAAAGACSGGKDKVTCGMQWTVPGKWDGSFGVGEQMSALEVIQNLLINSRPSPFTAYEGGSSVGDPGAGTGGDGGNFRFAPTTTGDRVGAGFLTTICVAMIIGGTYWLVAV